MLDYLTTWHGDPSLQRRLEILTCLQSWKVVVRIVVIHTNARAAAQSGLFGLLGDAPVQILDIANEVQIDQFFDFAAKCHDENHIPVDLHRDSTDLVTRQMKTSILEKYGSMNDKLFLRLRPAIMFRLCMCKIKRRRSPPPP
ncbi:hypothetical protein BO94DRAFT_480079 [Aspergillus sclerotioniger CBS 115572]|uniref:Uncharacterized protein n=1 Tax=Aspergillus sclerotioniger CBS 115572 TaxID=1450535 RepID=A0A317UYS1_9EURO|nr:hypothetical protein BO94DRAFT_480079 [Aspergillus sclerotioniger CBS 115572]PWY65642.1 hypothetical protein BO94DRAFT_480079 [Aspergillus sclerotioniger CBS 115572]